MNFRHVLRRFDRQAVAALEFCLVAPVLVSLLYGVYDISEAVLFYQEVYNTAHSIAASASGLADQPNGSTNLNYTQIQFLESEIWGEIPTLRGYYQDGTKSVTLSSVVFEPTFTTSTCTTGTATTPCYVPVVVWSVPYTGGDSGRSFTTATVNGGNPHLVYFAPTIYGAATYTSQNSAANLKCGSSGQAGTTGTTSCTTGYVGNNTGQSPTGEFPYNPLRPCDSTATSPASTIIGSLNQTTPTGGSASDLTNLKTLNLSDINSISGAPGAIVAAPSPILVVDVHLQYKPLLGLVISAPLDFWVTAYWPVRSVQTVVTGTTTPLTLYKQFTTITYSSVYSGGPVEPYSDWCINQALAGATT